MVKPFQFARLPKIIFRNGSIKNLTALIDESGSPVMLISGRSSFTGSARGKNLLHDLQGKNIAFSHVIIPGEPSPSMIDNAVEKNNNKNVKLVVAIGGGSVLDAGKAISAMLRVSGSVKEYLEGVGHKNHPGTKVPFIAIPTTSGTGSEATKNAVISEVGPEGFKKSLRHDQFVPDVALLDAELILDCPPDITAASGMDCFTQLTEAYLSEKASDYTDAFALLGLKAVKDSLLEAVKNGHNLEARAGMAYAALNSGICLANAGLGTVHGFASTIGGKYAIPHGLVCGTLMAVTNRVNARELRVKKNNINALKKYATLGRLFLETENNSDDYYIEGFIEFLYNLTSELSLPDLSGFGLNKEALEDISMNTGNKNNPVDLGIESKMEILEERL